VCATASLPYSSPCACTPCDRKRKKLLLLPRSLQLQRQRRQRNPWPSSDEVDRAAPACLLVSFYYYDLRFISFISALKKTKITLIIEQHKKTQARMLGFLACAVRKKRGTSQRAHLTAR
jgi:hypothetical protein